MKSKILFHFFQFLERKNEPRNNIVSSNQQNMWCIKSRWSFILGLASYMMIYMSAQKGVLN